MRSRTQTVNNLEHCFDAIEALTASLNHDEWETQSLCPAWTNRGVIGHLIGIEWALTGWDPGDGDTPPPFDKIPAFEAEVAEMSADDLVTRTTEVLAARRAELTAMSDEVFTGPSMTPVGKGTYHRFMDVRVFDFWVHERDITTPIGRPTEDGGPAAESAVDEIQMSIGYIVGKKIGLPDGMSIAFNLTGPVERNIYAAVEGRAGGVDHLDDPTVSVSADSLTFVQLACGRIDPQAAIDAGRITWTETTSDASEWGEKAARNLAFTM